MCLCVPCLPGTRAYLFPAPPWDRATPRSPRPPGPPWPPGSRGGDLGEALAGQTRAAALTCAGPWQVMYKEKDLDAQPRAWLVEGNSSRSAQLTGLGKYVLYEVQVLAFTRVGDGSPSHPPVLERTLDDGEFEALRAWGRRGDGEPSCLLPLWGHAVPQREPWPQASPVGSRSRGPPTPQQGGAGEGRRVPKKEMTTQGPFDF